MKEKEKPPLKPRKLKKIDEYREVIPRAWKIYQHEVARDNEPRKAELKAVKMLYPADKNSSTTLSVWKKYGLWPPEAQEKAALNNKNGLTVVNGGNAGQRKLGLSALLKASAATPPATPSISPELSEDEILQGVRKILDKIEVHHKEWTGGRLKKYSTLKTKVFAGRLPVDLINEINKLRGSHTFHLERALRLYVKVMGAKDS